MKINNGCINEQVFEKLDNGDIFYYKDTGEICIKVQVLYEDEYGWFNAVSLHDGFFLEIEPTEKVLVCEAELNIVRIG